MRFISATTCTLLSLAFAPGAASAIISANDPVVYTCENPEAAGFRNVGGHWTPTRLQNTIRLKITEERGEWSVWVKYHDSDWIWTSTDKKPPNGEDWFSPKSSFGGVKFDLFIKTRHYSFTNTLDYLMGDPNVAPVLIIGQCTRY